MRRAEISGRDGVSPGSKKRGGGREKKMGEALRGEFYASGEAICGTPVGSFPVTFDHLRVACLVSRYPGVTINGIAGMAGFSWRKTSSIVGDLVSAGVLKVCPGCRNCRNGTGRGGPEGFFPSTYSESEGKVLCFLERVRARRSAGGSEMAPDMFLHSMVRCQGMPLGKFSACTGLSVSVLREMERCGILVFVRDGREKRVFFSPLFMDLAKMGRLKTVRFARVLLSVFSGLHRALDGARGGQLEDSDATDAGVTGGAGGVGGAGGDVGVVMVPESLVLRESPSGDLFIDTGKEILALTPEFFKILRQL